MNKEEIKRIVDLFDKGYCNECNELNCLGGMPSSRKVADCIKQLQSQLTKSNNKIGKIKEYIKKRLKHNEDYIKTESEDANLLYLLSIIDEENK